MHHYDIAGKILINACRDEIIGRFVGINVRESSLIEVLPQETVSLKRSDYPVLVTDDKGITKLVILELQTEWNRKVPLNLLDYRTRYLLEHNMEAISCVILLRPSLSATDFYKDNEVSFTYRLVKIFEMDGEDILNSGSICLLPFVPLMKNGAELVNEADTLIYQSGFPREKKADMLTCMAILSGLVSDKIPTELISRRKDIMIESAAYEIIRQDGIRDGLTESLMAMLEMKFGLDGIKIHNALRKMSDVRHLRMLIEVIKLAKSPEDVLKFAETQV